MKEYKWHFKDKGVIFYSSLRDVLSPFIGEFFQFKETIFKVIGLEQEKTFCGLKYNVYIYEEIHSKKKFRISESKLISKFDDGTLKYFAKKD